MIPLYIVPRFTNFINEQIKMLSLNFDITEVVLPYNQLVNLIYEIPYSKLKNYLFNYKVENLYNEREFTKKIRLHLIKYQNVIPNSKNINLGKTIFKKIKRSLNLSSNLNLVHSHYIWPYGEIGTLIGYEKKIPTILSIHGSNLYQLAFKNDRWNRKIKLILEKTDHLITVSNFLKNILIDRFHINLTKISLVPNGYDSKLFFPRKNDKLDIRKKLCIPVDKKILLNVANLWEVKDHFNLVKSLHILKNKRGDFLCFIIGEGPLKIKIKQLIKKLELQENVFLIGAINHELIPFWMNSADLFVLSSKSEGFGIVLIEALACGIPCISTKNGGSEDIIINQEIGYLVEKEDPLDLSNKIEKALNRNWNHTFISDYAKNNFSWFNICGKIKNIYEKIN